MVNKELYEFFDGPSHHGMPGPSSSGIYKEVLIGRWVLPDVLTGLFETVTHPLRPGISKISCNYGIHYHQFS